MPPRPPIDADERRIAETRAAMRMRVLGLWVRFGVGQFLFLAGSVVWHTGPPGLPEAVASAVGIALSLASAGFACVLTLRHRPSLTGGAVAAGLLPWAIVLAEATLLIAAAV